jgi:membrane dipeptidase
MSDVERIFGSRKVASVLGMEGGHAIENSLGALRAYYDLGARYMTLTHSGNNDWADSGTDDPEHDGLTEFGAEVVREMNRLGMMVDLSHTSPETMNDALDVAEAPVIFSHSSARAVTNHLRNVPDQVLRRLPDNGGVVMVTFVPAFISDAVRTFDGSGDPPRATLGDVADHIEHIRDVAGVDHVGIGSDFDGIEDTPIGLEDVSTFPTLLAELSRRGWSEEDLAKLAGGNVMRVWRDAETAASRIQRTRGPSTATIEELDGRSIS